MTGHAVVAASKSPAPSATADIRESYKARKAQLLAALKSDAGSTRSIRGLLQALSEAADEALRKLWERAGLPAGAALVAVGGFGRGELFPHSDVDVLLLVPDGISCEHDAALKLRVENFIGSCWDAGLEIGSSVRTLQDCLAQAASDVTVQTSLLEARLVTGSRKLFTTFQQRYLAQMDPVAFFTAKTLEMRQRHT